MKKAIATLAAITLTMTAMGAPMAFADTSTSSPAGQVTVSTTSSTGSQGTMDSSTQTQADSTTTQILGDASQSAQVSGTAPAAGYKTGKGSVVDQLQDILNRAAHVGKDRTKDAQQLKLEVAHLRQTQKAIHNDQKNLLAAAHKFVDAIHQAEKSGDKQVVVNGIAAGKRILSTLKNALSDESKVYADVQAARQDAKSGHVDKALVLMHDAETKEKAKDDAIKQATMSLRLLAADIAAHVQNSGNAQAGSDNGASGTTQSGTAGNSDGASVPAAPSGGSVGASGGSTL